MDLKDRCYIFLNQIKYPMLANTSTETYQATQSLCTAAKVLWVQGAQEDLSANPDSAMVIGLTRSVRLPKVLDLTVGDRVFAL